MTRASRYEIDSPRVLELLAAASARHAKPPTVRDLADHFGVGVATMHSYLQKLAAEGLVTWSPGAHRTLRLTREGALVTGG